MIGGWLPHLSDYTSEEALLPLFNCLGVAAGIVSAPDVTTTSVAVPVSHRCGTWGESGLVNEWWGWVWVWAMKGESPEVGQRSCFILCSS